MNANKSHIEIEKIADYFAGKLSNVDMQALEAEALNDPFLYEAMEGYADHPEGINRVRLLKKRELARSKSFFGSRTLVVLGSAILIYLLAILLRPEIQENDIQALTGEEINLNEFELIPESIDTFQFAAIEEQITAKEIVQNKSKIKEQQDSVIKSSSDLPDVVLVDDVKPNDPNMQIEPENITKSMTVYAPSIFQFNLYVVDYSRIERKQTISYTKHVLSGLSAEFESESTQNRTELIEQVVDIPYMNYLETSMNFFSSGDLKKALNRYLTILEQYPDDLNAHFYGGLCYLNMKKYDLALNSFERTLSIEKQAEFVAFREEAKWYKAKTLIKLGRNSEAKELLNEIIIEGQFYTQKAIKLKSSL